MRKLLMLTAMAFAAMAVVSTAAASARTIEVRDHATGQLCPPVVLSGTTVTGGCLIEDVIGNFSMYAPPSTFIATYGSSFDLRIGGNGGGFAVNPYVIRVAGPPAAERDVCRNASGVALPWMVAVGDFLADAGATDASIRTCTAPPANPAANHLVEADFFDPVHFGADGWSELVQDASSGYYRNGYYIADSTVDVTTIP
jgi:hypothetical protein